MISQETAAFFFERVVHEYQGFIEVQGSSESGRSRDLAAGLNAALAIYHFGEHLTGSYAIEVERVVIDCPDYALCRDVADVAKHRSLDRASAKLRDSSALAEVLIVTIYKDQFGEYRDTSKTIELKLLDGTTRDLATVLTNSINYWSDYLNTRGMQPRTPMFRLPNLPQPLARAQCRNAGVNTSLVRGLRFQRRFKFQQYNYETKRVEPVDLTGATVHAWIYQPRYTVDLTLRHEATGAEFKRTIALNPEQAGKFDALESEEARQEFVRKLPQTIDFYANTVSKGD